MAKRIYTTEEIIKHLRTLEIEKDRRKQAVQLTDTSYQIPTVGTTPASTNTYALGDPVPLTPALKASLGDTLARVVCASAPTNADFNTKGRETCRQILTRSYDGANREDASNYTLAQNNGTVYHEVGHVFGFDDEYMDSTYPYTPQGEVDSTMNNSSDDSRLYSRHLKQILSPLSCPAAQ